MLLNNLCDERKTNMAEIVKYPLGALCYVIDELNQGGNIETVLNGLSQYRLAKSSIELVAENKQLIILLINHHNEFNETKDVLRILYMMVFNTLPENIKEAV